MARHMRVGYGVKISPSDLKSLIFFSVLAFIALVLGLIGGYQLADKEHVSGPLHGLKPPPGVRLATVQDPLWPLIKEIAGQFQCRCGECKGMSLADCLCMNAQGGIAEKRYIRLLLVSGYDKAKTIELVEKRFGGRVRTDRKAEPQTH